MIRNAIFTTAGSLPVRRTNFVGRVAELQAVGVELRTHRLLSLVGPGGSGKTRLALEAAHGWHDGVRCFVDLTPVEPEEVGAALAVATAAPETAGEDPVDAVARRIGAETVLLLVDNCDQVLADAARAVERLLVACPNLTVLATSREPLRAGAERVWRVPPLSLPQQDDPLDGDAVLLFLERAGLTPETATRDLEQVRQICQRLDGMPLAIELAASRATTLPTADILTGLSDRFRLLTGGPRTADTRQQSLAGSIKWSYRLLDAAERTVLQRLAVFRSAFSADAARAVAAGDGIAEQDVLSVLANLVEKSFVVVDQGPFESRYRLLETIREYALAELEPGDTAATKHRHLRFLRESAERVEPVFDGPDLLRHIDRLETELPDVRAAVAWAAETGEADEALRLVAALGPFWQTRVHAEGLRIVRAALAIPGGSDAWRAKAVTVCTLAAFVNFNPEALAFGKEAVRLATAVGDASLQARAQCWLGWVSGSFDPAAANELLRHGCELARRAGDDWCLAQGLHGLATATAGDLPTALAYAEESLAYAERGRYDFVAWIVRLSLTGLATLQGRLDEADRHAAHSMAFADPFVGGLALSVGRFFVTRLAALRGDHDVASDSARACAEQSPGDPLSQGLAAGCAGVCAYAAGELAQARETLPAALPVLSVYVDGLFASSVLEMLSDAALRVGDEESARDLAKQAVERAGDLPRNRWGQSRAAIAASRVALHDGDLASAEEAIGRALVLARRNEDAVTTIDALELLAALARQRNEPQLAARLLGAAAAERDRIGYARLGLHVPDHDALVKNLEDVLGHDEFAAAGRHGRGLSISEAVALVQDVRGRRGRPATGWDALTPAELRVALLVGAGLANAQIADRLFVSGNTVKGHVSAAFRKLGVANRSELAAEAARRGLPGNGSAG